jgi:hypothetical protein
MFTHIFSGYGLLTLNQLRKGQKMNRQYCCDVVLQEMREELKNALITAWALIRQSTIDRLSGGFKSRLELCLANAGESISNQLWWVTELDATKDVLEVNRVYVPWTPEEDDRPLQDWLTVGPRWKFPEKRWETRSASQLKHRWYLKLRHRLHGTGSDLAALTSVLEQGRQCLQVPTFTK